MFWIGWYWILKLFSPGAGTVCSNAQCQLAYYPGKKEYPSGLTGLFTQHSLHLLRNWIWNLVETSWILTKLWFESILHFFWHWVLQCVWNRHIFVTIFVNELFCLLNSKLITFDFWIQGWPCFHCFQWLQRDRALIPRLRVVEGLLRNTMNREGLSYWCVGPSQLLTSV